MNTDYLNASIVSDLHKDAYGYRPDNIWWTEWYLVDDAGKLDLWNMMIEALDSEV